LSEFRDAIERLEAEPAEIKRRRRELNPQLPPLVVRDVKHVRDDDRPVGGWITAPIGIGRTTVHAHVCTGTSKPHGDVRVLLPRHAAVHARRVGVEVTLVVRQHGVRADASVAPRKVGRRQQGVDALHVGVAHRVRVVRDHLGHPGLEYLGRIRRASTNVLGNSVTGREILELCDDHSEARNRILDDRTSGVTVIATVGATGQGKSWITRQLIGNQDAKKLIRSGNNSDEATEQLTWVGPSPPENLDTGSEKYIHCASSEMEPIGTPYLVVDAPGATDDRRSIAGIAHRALSMASVMLLVVRADQMRSDSIGALAAASEGTIVIPVINAARS